MIFGKLFKRVRTRSDTIDITRHGSRLFGYGSDSSAGVAVNEFTIKGIPAFSRAVDLVASHTAGLDVNVLTIGSNGKERATNHSAYGLIKHAANPRQSAFVVKKMIEADRTARGNGYGIIYRDEFAKATEWYRLNPEAVHPVIDPDGELWYMASIGGEYRKVHHLDMIHIMGQHTIDGIMGEDPLHVFKETFGVQIAQRKSQATVFKNGGSPGLIIYLPPGMEDDADIQKFARDWDSAQAGITNKGKAALLQDGFRHESVGFNNQELQMTELTQQGLVDIANIVGIMPGLVGSLVNTSYASQAQDQKNLLANSINPRLHDWEGQFNMKFLTENQKSRWTHVIEFDRSQLENIDIVALNQSLKIQLECGVIDKNEYRRDVGRSPREDENADRLMVSKSVVFLDDLAAVSATQVETAEVALENAKKPPVESTQQETPELPEDRTITTPEAPSEPDKLAEEERSALVALTRQNCERMAYRINKAIQTKGNHDLVERHLTVLTEVFRPVQARSAELLAEWLEAKQEELAAALPEQVMASITADALYEVIR